MSRKLKYLKIVIVGLIISVAILAYKVGQMQKSLDIHGKALIQLQVIYLSDGGLIDE